MPIKPLIAPVPRTGAAINPCAACAVRDLSICGAIEGDDHKLIETMVGHRQLSAGDALFHEGDPADHHFIVTDGCLKLSKLMADGRRQITGFLFRSDFLGLAFRERYAYSAEAVGPTSICRFPRRKFEDLLGRFPALERRLLSMASNELAATHDQMLLLGRKTALERVASFLTILARRDAMKPRPGDAVVLPMTRTDIADYLGLTIETVSRSLTRLRKDNAIKLLDTHRIGVVSKDRLADIGGLSDEWSPQTSLSA